MGILEDALRRSLRENGAELSDEKIEQHVQEYRDKSDRIGEKAHRMQTTGCMMTIAALLVIILLVLVI